MPDRARLFKCPLSQGRDLRAQTGVRDHRNGADRAGGAALCNQDSHHLPAALRHARRLGQARPGGPRHRRLLAVFQRPDPRRRTGLAHLCSCPQGNDPLQFIFGDLLACFTPEEECIVATLSYPTEPIPVTAIAEISGVDEPTTCRALKLLTNRSIVVPQEGEEKYALVPFIDFDSLR